MPSAYRHQLTKLYLISFCAGFVFWYGIEKIFLSNVLGIGPAGVSVLVAVYMSILLIFDVPAGVLADRWGKKRTLMLALTSFIISDIVLGSALNFPMYILGTAFWGFFTVLYYGTYEALLYDSASQIGRKDDYHYINARQQAWFMLGIGLSSIPSGFLANALSLQFVYYLSIVPLAVALIVSLSLHEPRSSDDDESIEAEIVSHWQHLIGSFREIFGSPILRLIALGMFLVLAMMTPVYEFAQYVYIDVFRGDVVQVGVANGVAGLLLVIGFLVATRIKRSTVLLLAAAVGLLLTTALLQNNVALVVFMFLFVLMPIVDNRIQVQVQHAVSNKKRATMTSAVNFLGNIFIVPFVLLLGFIAEHQSIWLAYATQAVVVGAVLIFYWFGVRRTRII